MTPEQHKAIETALKDYWASRRAAKEKQQQDGLIDDTGERSTATSGVHLDSLAAHLAQVCITAGAPADQVFYRTPQGARAAGRPRRRLSGRTAITFPGYFRPTKEWDLVVYHRERPIVAVELKSQNGPSYSNNANNRVEEAIGSAVDLKRACDALLIPGRPWLGYVYVIEDDLTSRRRGGSTESSMYPRDSVYEHWSYVDRVRLLCTRLVADGYYGAAWAVATSRPDCPGTPEKPTRCPQLKSKYRDDPLPIEGLSAPDHAHEFAWYELDTTNLGHANFAAALAEQVGAFYSPGDTVIVSEPKLF
ncbi:PaeR7I family type II restriction endonuclease [Dactylosporangium sp. NPDC005555]|uniref:PaeR7I family type II restriction endonuclease n=1 Tax=Dactylosporangium sp. NPDC005555 TaxID=3154889 RepID=UPI00339F115E